MNKKKIVLTDDTLTNIQIMAPELSREQQLQVFGMIIGIAMTDGRNLDIDTRNATKKQETCVCSHT